MNRSAFVFVVSGLVAAASPALAAPPAKPQPALMTEAQMDNVTAGALGDGLVTVIIQDSLNNWNLSVALKLQANVAANVNAGVSLIGSGYAEQLIGSQTQIIGNMS
jgi:hypothetical protein